MCDKNVFVYIYVKVNCFGFDLICLDFFGGVSIYWKNNCG